MMKKNSDLIFPFLNKCELTVNTEISQKFKQEYNS